MQKIEVKMEQKGLEMDIDKTNFAMALKTWRLRQNLTQKQAGERFGVSRFTIIRAEKVKNLSWESAYKLFAKLADALRVEALEERRKVEENAN